MYCLELLNTILFKSWETQNFITIKTSWNTFFFIEILDNPELYYN
jgi:hypothetical protein